MTRSIFLLAALLIVLAPLAACGDEATSTASPPAESPTVERTADADQNEAVGSQPALVSAAEDAVPDTTRDEPSEPDEPTEPNEEDTGEEIEEGPTDTEPPNPTNGGGETGADPALDGILGNPLLLALGVLVLAALAGGVAVLVMRRGAASRVETRHSYTNAGPPAGKLGRDINPGGVVPGRTPPPGARPAQPPADTRVTDALEERIRVLESQVSTLVQSAARATPAPAPTAAAPPPVAPPAPSRSPVDAVAVTFADWCRSRGGLVNRRELFAAELSGAVPGASVEAVFRDLDTPARPVRFDGKGGLSPAEYWLVRLGGDRLLLPQPQGPGQFRDLAPVFEGHATPASLGSVAPAHVREEGGVFVLTQPGRVA